MSNSLAQFGTLLFAGLLALLCSNPTSTELARATVMLAPAEAHASDADRSRDASQQASCVSAPRVGGDVAQQRSHAENPGAVRRPTGPGATRTSISAQKQLRTFAVAHRARSSRRMQSPALVRRVAFHRALRPACGSDDDSGGDPSRRFGSIA